MTVWAYYRVSTDKQDFESQKVGVVDYCKRAGITIDKEVIDDGVSGTVKAYKRNLGHILVAMRKDDILITSELSRLGRSTIDVLDTCKKITDAGVKCYFVKQGLTLDQSPMGKLMISIFAAFAELERDLISMRTKEGLKRVKASGVKLGRKFGAKNNTRWFDGKESDLEFMILNGGSDREIAKEFNVSPRTVWRYKQEHGYGNNLDMEMRDVIKL